MLQKSLPNPILVTLALLEQPSAPYGSFISEAALGNT